MTIFLDAIQNKLNSIDSDKDKVGSEIPFFVKMLSLTDYYDPSSNTFSIETENTLHPPPPVQPQNSFNEMNPESSQDFIKNEFPSNSHGAHIPRSAIPTLKSDNKLLLIMFGFMLVIIITTVFMSYQGSRKKHKYRGKYVKRNNNSSFNWIYSLFGIDTIEENVEVVDDQAKIIRQLNPFKSKKDAKESDLSTDTILTSILQFFSLQHFNWNNLFNKEISPMELLPIPSQSKKKVNSSLNTSIGRKQKSNDSVKPEERNLSNNHTISSTSESNDSYDSDDSDGEYFDENVEKVLSEKLLARSEKPKEKKVRFISISGDSDSNSFKNKIAPNASEQDIKKVLKKVVFEKDNLNKVKEKPKDSSSSKLGVVPNSILKSSNTPVKDSHVKISLNLNDFPALGSDFKKASDFKKPSNNDLQDASGLIEEEDFLKIMNDTTRMLLEKNSPRKFETNNADESLSSQNTSAFTFRDLVQPPGSVFPEIEQRAVAAPVPVNEYNSVPDLFFLERENAGNWFGFNQVPSQTLSPMSYLEQPAYQTDFNMSRENDISAINHQKNLNQKFPSANKSFFDTIFDKNFTTTDNDLLEKDTATLLKGPEELSFDSINIFNDNSTHSEISVVFTTYCSLLHLSDTATLKVILTYTLVFETTLLL